LVLIINFKARVFNLYNYQNFDTIFLELFYNKVEVSGFQKVLKIFRHFRLCLNLSNFLKIDLDNKKNFYIIKKFKIKI